MRISFLLIAAALAALRLAAQAAPDLEPFAFLAGRELSAPEAEGLWGGDTRIELDESRTRLRVRVWDNEYESRLGRQAPVEDYTVEAHNRIVETKEAPFYPVEESCKDYAGQSGLTTRPTDFPAGNWKVTSVEARDDKYGPFMIKTDAVGSVEVYKEGNKVGQAKDGGYALHSNTKDFSVSKSYGCVVIKQEDSARVAASLRRDANNYREKQLPLSFGKERDCGLQQRVSVRSRRER